mgnify:CR=1 FL=1
MFTELTAAVIRVGAGMIVGSVLGIMTIIVTALI